MGVTIMSLDVPSFLNSLYKGAPETEKHKVTLLIDTLLTNGWKMKFSMFMVTLFREQTPDLPAFSSAENLPYLVPQISGDKIAPKELALCRSVFEQIVGAAYNQYEDDLNKKATGGTAAKTVAEDLKKEFGGPAWSPPGPGAGVATADVQMKDIKVEIDKKKKAIVENQAGLITPKEAEMKAAAKSKKPVVPEGTKVISLKDANDIGQYVLGTTSGNVYKSVAVGELNVGVRIHGSGLSIRVERGSTDFTPTVVQRLAAIGFSKKPDYMSMHVAINVGMPASRVIGAVLMSMEVQFNKLVQNGKDFT